MKAPRPRTAPEAPTMLLATAAPEEVLALPLAVPDALESVPEELSLSLSLEPELEEPELPVWVAVAVAPETLTPVGIAPVQN